MHLLLLHGLLLLLLNRLNRNLLNRYLLLHRMNRNRHLLNSWNRSLLLHLLNSWNKSRHLLH